MKSIFVILLLLAAGIAVGLYFLGQQSQDGSAAGLVQGKLSACPSSPNCVSSENGTAQSQSVEALPASDWQRLPAAIEAMGGSITQRNGNYIAAEFTSSVFKFTDDVEFRLDGDAVHVRSASRVGYSDMSANRNRIEALRARL